MPEQREEVALMERQGVRAAGALPDRSSPRSATETAKTLYKTPALVSHHVRCGKPGCRCTTGEGHGPYWFLYWREGATQRRRYVPAAEMPSVRSVVERRRTAEQADRQALEQSLEAWRGMQRWLRDLETTGRQ